MAARSCWPLAPAKPAARAALAPSVKSANGVKRWPAEFLKNFYSPYFASLERSHYGILTARPIRNPQGQCQNIGTGCTRLVNGFLRKRSWSAPTVFLTGVTGFLGGAFLSDLLQSPFDGEVVCLVRADDDDTAEERVRRSLGRFTTSYSLPKNVKVLRG